eukprot:8563732-Pyramimonas_sp.AAC.3
MSVQGLRSQCRRRLEPACATLAVEGRGASKASKTVFLKQRGASPFLVSADWPHPPRCLVEAGGPEERRRQAAFNPD